MVHPDLLFLSFAFMYIPVCLKKQLDSTRPVVAALGPGNFGCLLCYPNVLAIIILKKGDLFQ